MSSAHRAILVDITRCSGCRACMEACMRVHGFAGDPFQIDSLSASAYTIVEEKQGLFVRKLCMHCVRPSCASVCPVSALTKTAQGAVTYDASRCLGCRYCIQACPFNVPRYEWDKAVPAVAKCDLCIDRLRRNEPPACVEACPADAVVSGSRDELLAEAHRRIESAPGDYFPHVYGESEIGGTSVLFLSPVSFASIGFNVGLGEEPLPMRTQEALQRIPGIVTIGGALLLAIWWITQRREEVAREKAALAEAACETDTPARRRSRS